jgi:hypothetical protein
VSGTVGVGKFFLERPSIETQNISVAMERWSVGHPALAVETYFQKERLCRRYLVDITWVFPY